MKIKNQQGKNADPDTIQSHQQDTQKASNQKLGEDTRVVKEREGHKIN
jgi:hypothetical protein